MADSGGHSKKLSEAVYVALRFAAEAPWEYWRVLFCEKGICRWDEFGDMNARDVHGIIAVWDGIAKAEKAREKTHGGTG